MNFPFWGHADFCQKLYFAQDKSMSCHNSPFPMPIHFGRALRPIRSSAVPILALSHTRSQPTQKLPHQIWAASEELLAVFDSQNLWRNCQVQQNGSDLPPVGPHAAPSHDPLNCAPRRLSRTWDGHGSVLTLSMTQSLLNLKSDFAVLILFFFFQTVYSMHVLLLQQKSGHVVIFFAGSGHVFPGTW